MNKTFPYVNSNKLMNFPFLFTGVCDSEPCQNGGQCLHGAQTGTHICLCVHGFTGDLCEIGMLRYTYKGGIRYPNFIISYFTFYATPKLLPRRNPSLQCVICTLFSTMFTLSFANSCPHTSRLNGFHKVQY